MLQCDEHSRKYRFGYHEPMPNQIEKLENELHELDHRMESLRRRTWAIEHGLEIVPEPEVELARLRAEFDEAARRFTVTYRAWSKEHAEE
jgi:phosphatidylserine/phosphatidylglycerophosphate/cardiolipin synthase-like enzyme